MINHKYSPIAEIRQNSPRRDAMIKFDKEQKVFDIAGVKVGGQPGEYPTVLIGSIFHQKHKIVSDPSKGEFDVAAAQSLIKKNEELYDKTGNPFILDVVATNANALMKYIEFVADVTDAPFLVDGPSADVRLQAMRRAVEIGLRNRAIYNSLDYRFSSEEVSELKEIGVESSMLLAYSPRNVWAEGRLEMLESQPRRMGLLEASENAGIKNRLVDTAVLDAPSMGFSAKAIYLVKEKYGLPAGCAPANAIIPWERLKKEYVRHAYLAGIASSVVMNAMFYADFVLYGPIQFAESVYPSCALADAVIAYSARRLGVRPKVKNHPLFKIF